MLLLARPLDPAAPQEDRDGHDEDERHEQHERRQRVHGGRDAEPDRRVEHDRPRRRRPVRERRKHVVVERERERQEQCRDHGRHQPGKRHLAERGHRARAEVVRGLLELVAHADEPGPDDEHGERRVEHDLPEQDRRAPERRERAEVAAHLHEEDERRHRDHDLGDDQRQVDQHVEGSAPAALHPCQRERGTEPEDRRDDRSLERDEEARLDRVRVEAGVETLREPARREAVPDRDVADVGRLDVADVRALERRDRRRRRLVEREDDDDQDRQVEERVDEDRPGREAALRREDPPPPTHRTAPRASRT